MVWSSVISIKVATNLSITYYGGCGLIKVATNLSITYYGGCGIICVITQGKLPIQRRSFGIYWH